jgi:uncharacterized membrane protein
MKTWRWLLILGVGLAVVFLFGVFLFGGAGYRWMPMHARLGGFPMMGGFRMFGAGMMLFRLIIPLLLIGLIVAGIILVVSVAKQPKTVTPAASCSNCGKPVQPDWINCPYCGEKL